MSEQLPRAAESAPETEGVEMTDDAAPEPTAPSPEAPAHVFPAFINIRSTSLAVLAFIATVAFLYWARAVFIPITISILASYALTPVVFWLRKRARIPEVIGAALTLACLLFGFAYGVESLQPEAMHVLEIVPRATAKFSAAIRQNALEPRGTVERMKAAATEIDRAASAATGGETTVRTQTTTTVTTPARSATPAFEVRDYLLIGTVSAIAGVAQLIVIVALTYFLLIAGDNFRRTLVRLSGDTLSKKKLTVAILEEIHAQIQRYLFVQVAASALLAVLLAVLFSWLHLDNALFWACAGGILHLVPYAGPAVLFGIVGLVSYAQFDQLQPVVLILGGTLAAVGVVGLLLVPWLTQKVGRLNAVMVFVSLLFWGWLWGVWGLLLGVPIVMAINAICERVEDLRPISEFLGYARTKRPDGSGPGTPTD